ncbi:protein cornichon homolog 3 isoform X5 [Symphalangus syndactylus]|uniref:protein cornichon homolog 3 isoform X5 n=1 Tax=Symphalangus syndactylus TaxID=9590 RepID=UPI0030050FC2
MAELACVRESTSVAWACKVRGGTASSPSGAEDYTWESGLLVSLQRLGSTLLKNGWLAFTVASASIQISASSCPSTLSTNISFAKLGGSVSLFTFLVLSLKLGLRDLVRNVSSGVSTGTAICHCLRSCVAADQVFSRHHVTLRMDVTCWRKQKAKTLTTSQSCQNSS